MKAYIATALVTALLPISAYAQGTVNFSSANANQTVKLGANGVGAGYTAGLYWGILGSTEAQMILLGSTVPVTANSGFIINGGTRTTGAGTAAGSPGLFQVRAWDGAFASYAAALAAGTGNGGVSAIFQNPTGNPGAQPPGTPSALSGWTSPVQVAPLTPVPEPSTIALAALGLAGLVLIRRRK